MADLELQVLGAAREQGHIVSVQVVQTVLHYLAGVQRARIV